MVALRGWMTVFADRAATKHGMIDTLRALMKSGWIEHGRMRDQLIVIVSEFLPAGVAAGDLRSDVACGCRQCHPVSRCASDCR